MQISWIDPEELRGLANLLLDPRPPLNRGVSSLELHTLPSALAIPTQGTVSEIAEEESGEFHSEARPLEADPALASIREKLRAIRDRALQAGLISAAPVPVPEPVAPQPASTPITPTSEPPSTPGDATPIEEEVEALPAPSAAPHPQPAVGISSRPAFLPLEGGIAERLESFAQWTIQLTEALEIILVDDHGDLLRPLASPQPLALSALLSSNLSLRSHLTDAGPTPAVVHTSLQTDSTLSIIPGTTRYGNVTVAVLGRHPVIEEVAQCIREALILAVDGAHTIPPLS